MVEDLSQAMSGLNPRLWLASGPPASFQLAEGDYAKAPLTTALALAVCMYACMYRCLEVTAPEIHVHRLMKLSSLSMVMVTVMVMMMVMLMVMMMMVMMMMVMMLVMAKMMVIRETENE